jgi:hypothetical protein
MLDKDGNIWLQDYPYAQDGLELWEELEAYFTEVPAHPPACPPACLLSVAKRT